MAIHKTTGKPADLLPEEAAVSRTYGSAAHDAPPAALDAKILAQAHKAVATARSPFSRAKRWAVPLSTAAVLVLSVGVVVQLSDRGAFDDEITTVAREAPSAPADVATADSDRAKASPKSDVPAAAPQAPSAPTFTKHTDVIAQSKPTPESAVSAPAAPAPPPADTTAERERKSAAVEEARRSQRAMARRDVAATAQEPAATVGLMARQAAPAKRDVADVLAVKVSGEAGAYEFAVTVSSLDRGCQQYADWWEVVSEDGRLLYRRVLEHSHVGEQPFTRSGASVPIQPDTIVWIRAHMNTTGYSGVALRGSVQSGFVQATPPATFAAALAKQPPLPEGCAN
jgi:hypothetical protein